MRTGSEKKKKFRWKWLIIILSIIAAGILTAAIIWGAGIYSALDNFKKTPEESIFKVVEPKNVVEVPKWEGTERVNIMLLGGDARDAKDGDIARSDSILVASIDPVTKKGHLFSVLRDTYAEIPDHGDGRINTAVTIGGPPLAMKTVGNLLGLEIQYFVYTDFEGFKALIDTIGGVNFEVEKDMRYRDNADGNRYDIDLKKGYQLLDGDKALQYVRFRHDAMSDFTRTERQRNFLTAVAKEMKSTWNIVQMKKILESVSPYIETNLSVSDMLKLGQLGVETQIGGTAQIPPMELVGETHVGGASVISIRDTDALIGYVQEVLLKDDTMLPPTESPSPDGKSNSDSTSTSGESLNSSSSR
ncbi:LCP family protein [Paenibacillus sp. GSMTC-2017]|uniref:LCP family protein n=1 Tax=Paenibacillus sp. GSMTC-2017 TaxID=2794350 RepID=UPI0018D8FA21|nr:LCP family protein [Paenibacillus sp. GSMTC-2017]MBH5318963.1 LCP family protein [Paenibacillus sp. GSMTC-2017]